MKQPRKKFNPTSEQVKFIHDRIGKMSSLQIAKEYVEEFKVKYKPESVRTYISALGMQNDFYKSRKRKPTDEELKFIKECLGKITPKKIGDEIGMSEYKIIEWIRDYSLISGNHKASKPKRRDRTSPLVSKGFFDVSLYRCWVVGY